MSILGDIPNAKQTAKNDSTENKIAAGILSRKVSTKPPIPLPA
jgi:hypothetical protein